MAPGNYLHGAVFQDQLPGSVSAQNRRAVHRPDRSAGQQDVALVVAVGDLRAVEDFVADLAEVIGQVCQFAGQSADRRRSGQGNLIHTKTPELFDSRLVKKPESYDHCLPTYR